MRWIKWGEKAPEKEGWYWWRIEDEDIDNTIIFVSISKKQTAEFCNGPVLGFEEIADSTEWFGPIAFPEEEAEAKPEPRRAHPRDVVEVLDGGGLVITVRDVVQALALARELIRTMKGHFHKYTLASLVIRSPAYAGKYSAEGFLKLLKGPGFFSASRLAQVLGLTLAEVGLFQAEEFTRETEDIEELSNWHKLAGWHHYLDLPQWAQAVHQDERHGTAPEEETETRKAPPFSWLNVGLIEVLPDRLSEFEVRQKIIDHINEVAAVVNRVVLVFQEFERRTGKSWVVPDISSVKVNPEGLEFFKEWYTGKGAAEEEKNAE